ncbi:MAG: cyclic nucleotide-binding domain-containing protein [Lachnospiraceae bacterium]|nr:cyclic nucleotide-binding domain-containing protein [Lachnospiraceae bacterium]
MKAKQLAKGQILCEIGQPTTNLYLLTSGSVSVTFPGGSFIIGKGDVVGICDISSETYQFTYTALEDITFETYDVEGIQSFHAMFGALPQLATLFCQSSFRQINYLLNGYSTICFESSMLSNNVSSYYDQYVKSCQVLGVTVHDFLELEEFSDFDPTVALDAWVAGYYGGLESMYAGVGGAVLSSQPGVSIGFLYKASLDSHWFLSAYRYIYDYRTSYYKLFIQDGGTDLFGLYQNLFVQTPSGHPERDTIMTQVNQMSLEVRNCPYLDANVVEQRIAIFQKPIASVDLDELVDPTAVPDVAEINLYEEILKNSLGTLLKFTEAEEEIANNFSNVVMSLRKVTDLASSDDSVSHLRKRSADAFVAFYQATFLKSVTVASLPLPVKLFLYFGYADEELVGKENLEYLCKLADTLDANKAPRVYTLYDWLRAIYTGKKLPSRNQYEEDYVDYVHNLKVTKKITEAQERKLMDDSIQRVQYELKNMFPTVNKITFGRISTYCPILHRDHFIKPLDKCLVTAQLLEQNLDFVRSIDFGAYYRETLYTHDKLTNLRDMIHVEYLPEFILMPNVGTRGVMWQEIEGRKRTTHARMMLPIFFLEDLQVAIIRMTGDYRWEMCKRIQGARWNDLSERSLTSEYFDYIQFYKRNNELSPEAKEKIKTTLLKAKNNFKEMFILDYLLWIMYEGAGSPRMNKVARTILFAHCPFSAQVRNTLMANPLYKEMTERYMFQNKKRLHHLDVLSTKITNAGLPVPQEILDEQAFAQR